MAQATHPQTRIASKSYLLGSVRGGAFLLALQRQLLHHVSSLCSLRIKEETLRFKSEQLNNNTAIGFEHEKKKKKRLFKLSPQKKKRSSNLYEELPHKPQPPAAKTD